MHQVLRGLVILGLIGNAASSFAKLSPEQVGQLPAPATRPIDFSKEIKPLFEASCIKCHGRGKSKGGFKLDNRAAFLQGGDSGSAALPGHSAESYVVELVSGLNPDNVMPQKGSKLTRDQVGILRAWIDQGAPWDETVHFGRLPPVNLAPAQSNLPVGPAAPSRGSGVDQLLSSYFARHQVATAKPISDRAFARRVYVDLIGLLPKPAELEAFVRDEHPDKRAKLVRDLLADNPRYAQHWLTFWNDLLRNDYKGTGYIDDGRKQITDWLYSALAKNLPFDQFVAQLINPNPESEGFVKGIVWRGVVNASQTPQMQAAQNISQVFMGVNLKCASCHDSFINDWTLADAYGLASVYADDELEMVLCDKPTGKKAGMKFLYPELGAIDAKAPKADRMKRLAEIITQQQNGRLARTVVNRLWARVMGRGLVEPLDDMEQQAWSPELLDWLAADLVANQYDLKKTLERILTSDAYQLPSVPATEGFSKEFVFRGPFVRRLSAEQFQDALAEVTGLWQSLPANTQADFAAGQPNGALSQVENPAALAWIWSQDQAAEKAVPGTVYFRRTIDLPAKPTQASAVIACDNSFKLFVNGKEISSGQDYNKPKVIDLLPHLGAGANSLAVAAVNDSASPDKQTHLQSSPAGLLFYARIRQEFTDAGVEKSRVWDVASDNGWQCATEKYDDWQKREFMSDEWQPALELGPVDLAPWRLERKFAQALSAAALAGHTRAALVASDPLMTALGRPNREQVMTSRASSATTLQALEMTNGKTLADYLKRASETLLLNQSLAPRDLIVRLFERALTRRPTAEELQLAEALVGAPAKKEGVEDLLWAVAMLPEFQLIY